jgi:hypothetical protein
MRVEVITRHGVSLRRLQRSGSKAYASGDTIPGTVAR